MDDFEIYEEDGDKILTSYTGHDKNVVIPEGIVAIDNFDDDFVLFLKESDKEVPYLAVYVSDIDLFQRK